MGCGHLEQGCHGSDADLTEALMAIFPRQIVKIRRQRLDSPARLATRTVGLTERDACFGGQGSVAKRGGDVGSSLCRRHGLRKGALNTMKIALMNQHQDEPSA